MEIGAPRLAVSALADRFHPARTVYRRVARRGKFGWV